MCVNVFVAVNKLVMNGVSIDIEQYPYTAQIIVHVGDEMGLCGGAVVSKRVVVTASHCIYANDQIIPAADIDVLLGNMPTVEN